MELTPGRKVLPMNSVTREKHLSWLTLFASTGTLICCALPIAFVTLGLGATVVAISSNMPFLVTLTLHKAWVFAGSGALLAVSGWLMFRPGRVCPTDPEIGALCDRTQIWSRRIFWVSVAIWGVGFSTAYLALPLRMWLEH
jgi:Na+/melibiose symporter-like transporter